MALNLKRKMYYGTAASVIVAVLGIVIGLLVARADSPDRPTQDQSGSGSVQVNGNDNAVQLNSEQFKDAVRGLSREQAAQEAKKYAAVAPRPGQRAPYLVVDAPRHLWVRSSGTTTGHHIGAAYNQSTIWADCIATTNFDPDATDDVGPVWLRIRWPTDKPNDRLAASQPSDPFPGWVYAGQTLPAGHNGKIPTCVNP